MKIATYEEPIEYIFSKNNSVPSGMKWNKAYLAKHKIGNRLPRGKAFNAHRHLERKVGSQCLGKLIIGSIKAALVNSGK